MSGKERARERETERVGQGRGAYKHFNYVFACIKRFGKTPR